MPSRRRSRELALEMLFQWDLANLAPEEVEDTFWALKNLDPAEHEFSKRIFRATVQDSKKVDRLLRKISKHWRLERMSCVDRNILRMATAEFLSEPETPKIVIINEALEIARRYSNPESVQFINGILDTIRKELESAA